MAQEFVADDVPERVVDVLEIVDVDEREHESLLGAVRAIDLARELEDAGVLRCAPVS